MSLPSTWGLTTLDIAGTWGSGGTPKKSVPAFYGGEIPWLVIGDLNDGYVTKSAASISESGLANSSAKLVSPGTVLIAMYGSIGKMGLTTIECATNQAIAYCRPHDGLINTKYLFYYLRSQRDQLLSQGKGGAQQNISQTVLKAYNFALPPIAEQKEIAARLDSLLAQVDSIKTRLDSIPAILKRFRQSVLAAAVSGRLIDSRVSSTSVVKDVAKVIGGLTKNTKRNDYPLKRPYLRVANVYENELRLDDVSLIGVEEKELNRVSLKGGDLLVVEGNGSIDQIGRVALWQDEIDGCVHQNHLIKVRPNTNLLLPKFSLYYFMSPQGKKQIVDRATSGAGLYTLSISKISSIEIPMYSLKEQTEIVRRVEQLFTFADQIEQRVKDAQSRVNNLTQSILAKAFRGELTADWREQNPDLISGENSAEALLEKIKVETSKIAPKERTRNRNKNKTVGTVSVRNSMEKSRRDEDVWHKAYLAGIIQESGSALDAEGLYSKSNLEVTEFYKQLAWEIDAGLIKSIGDELRTE